MRGLKAAAEIGHGSERSGLNGINGEDGEINGFIGMKDGRVVR